MSLLNKESFSSGEMQTVFEQYKLYVEMADRISQRRMSANTFFTTLNTLLFTFATFIGNKDLLWTVFIGVIGCVTSFAWYFTLNSYRQLNSGKFIVIHEIEKLLPLSGYAYEWEILASGKKKSKYWPLSHVEKVIPVIFFFAYIVYTLFQSSVFLIIVGIC